jgi:hypothetical protein
LSDNPSLQDLLEVQRHFGLPSPALVEKDWHVVNALGAITAADTAPARLVFGGGTALSRAHRLIRRMSEDIRPQNHIGYPAYALCAASSARHDYRCPTGGRLSV